jgi:hypothetical protein
VERNASQTIAAFGETLPIPLSSVPSDPIQIPDLSVQNPWNIRNVAPFKFCLIVPLIYETTPLGTMTYLDTSLRTDFENNEEKMCEVLETAQQVSNLFQEFAVQSAEDSFGCMSPNESSVATITHVLQNIKAPLRHLGALATTTIINPAKQQQEIVSRKLLLKKELQKGLKAITDYKKSAQFYSPPELLEPPNKRFSFSQSTSSSMLNTEINNYNSNYLFTPVQVVEVFQEKVHSQPQGDTDSRLKWDIHYPANPSMPGMINKLEISHEQLCLIADYLEILIILGFQQWKKMKITVNFKEGLLPNFLQSSSERLNMMMSPHSSLSSSISPRNSMNATNNNNNGNGSNSAQSSSSLASSSSNYFELEVTVTASHPIADIRSLFRKNDLTQPLQICDNFIENSMIIIPNHRFERLSPSTSNESRRMSYFYKKCVCPQPIEPIRPSSATTNPEFASKSAGSSVSSKLPSLITSFFGYRPVSRSSSRASSKEKYDLDQQITTEEKLKRDQDKDSGRTSTGGGSSSFSSETESFGLGTTSRELFQSSSADENLEANRMITPARKAKAPSPARFTGMFNVFQRPSSSNSSSRSNKMNDNITNNQQPISSKNPKHNSVVPFKEGL